MVAFDLKTFVGLERRKRGMSSIATDLGLCGHHHHHLLLLLLGQYVQMSADFCTHQESNKGNQWPRSKTRDESTHFEEFKEQSSFLALAQISLPGVAALAVQDDVDVVDRIKVVRVSRLHLDHVPRNFNHNSTQSDRRR